jgi:penicillin-binding protein 1A
MGHQSTLSEQLHEIWTRVGRPVVRRYRRSNVKNLIGLIVAILTTGALLAATTIALTPSTREIASATSSVPEELDLGALEAYAVRSQIFARDGSPLAMLHGVENREPVPLDRVPSAVIDAVLAVEDADFYSHNGVNFRAVARAFFENVSAGGIEQGGSTITQQLVKNALLSSERELERKKKEVPLALRLEEKLPKEAILEAYLNTVYFGSGAYGVQAAAETYWGVDVTQLGHAEGAMLAALIANPVSYDPTLRPDIAYQQRKIALERMVAYGAITRQEAAQYGSTPLPVRRCGSGQVNDYGCGGAEPPPPDDYFVEEVKQQLLDDPRMGATREERIQTVFGGGLRIHTTLDAGAQWAAELAAYTVPPPNDQGVTAAMVTLDNTNGAVRALVGGPGYENYKYDIVTHKPGRQTGSSFKTFVMLTALEQGNFPFDKVQGGGSFPCPDCEEDPYRIDGPGGTLESVTARSSNGAFVRLGQVVGLENVIELADELGLANALMDPGALSMPLGTFDMTPLEMAAAYASIPNGGNFVEPYMIERVEDREGNVLIEREQTPRRVFSESTACYATEILKEAVESGTGTRARIPGLEVAGKTGTTDEHADAWFVGFTPFMTTAVWMGNPESNQVSMQNLGGVQNYGGTYPAMIWRAFNEMVHENLPRLDFPTCEPPDRAPRNAYGEGDNFLNGFRFPAPERPRSSSGSRSPSAAPRTPGSTTLPAPPPTPPPAQPGPPENQGGGQGTRGGGNLGNGGGGND